MVTVGLVKDEIIYINKKFISYSKIWEAKVPENNQKNTVAIFNTPCPPLF